MQQNVEFLKKWWWRWIQHWWTHHVPVYLCTNHVGVHKRMFLVRNPALFGWELRLRSDTQFLARDPINVIQCLRGEGRQWTSSRGPIVLNYDRHRQLLQGLSWVLPFDSMIMMVFLFKVLISIIRNFQQLWSPFTLLGKPFWKFLIQCFLNCLCILS